jgi:two-component system, LytTR family, sensor kinase
MRFFSRSSDAPHRVLTSFWAFHIAGWFAIGFSMWLGVLSHDDQPLLALAGKMWFAVSGGLLSLLLRPFYRWLYNRDLPISLLIFIAAGCSYVTTVAWSAAYKPGAYALRAGLTGGTFEWPSWGAIIGGTLFYTFIMMAWSTLYFGIKYYREVEAERARAIKAESHAHRAELQALRYQIHPHFLFNTMNAISTLIAEERNREAERMVTRLSDFLRLTLEQDTTPEVPLAEELDFARRYLDIEHIRFGDRLQATIDTEPETLSALVPALVLQPLVENAVRHGIAPLESGGHLRIEARSAGDRLLLRVEDSGRGFGDGVSTRDLCQSGVGLSNTHARLEALYGDAFRFDLKRSDGGGCVVILDLPLRMQTEEQRSPLDTPARTATERPAAVNG